MNASDNNDVVFARLKALGDTIKVLKPGKGDATVVAVVQEVLGFLAACQAQDAIAVSMKVLEDAVLLSPQAGTILRLEGGLKLVMRHLRNSVSLPPVAGPACRILAAAAATSAVTQQALAKEKGVGALLLSACAVHGRDPAVAGPLAELMAHISRSTKGAVQLEVDGLLPVLQELLVTYLGNWPVFGWVLKLIKNLAKYEYSMYGGGCTATAVPSYYSTVPYGSGGAGAGPGGAGGGSSTLVAARGGGGVLCCAGEGVRLLLGVARVLGRVPEQRKLLKRTSRALWLLCPHLLLPLPPLEPLAPLPSKDAPHLAVPS
ncbi:hypothetical protein HYH03_018597, partial [Edaphochlamys debaryana]